MEEFDSIPNYNAQLEIHSVHHRFQICAVNVILIMFINLMFHF